MAPLSRRRAFCTTLGAFILLVFVQFSLVGTYDKKPQTQLEQFQRLKRPGLFRSKWRWSTLPQQYPVQTLAPLPTGPLADIPKIQHDFEPETYVQRVRRQERQHAVKEAFLHSWDGYKRNAWRQDEVAPLSGNVHNGFGGWGATLVDSLDTLWIMGLTKEFDVAVSEIKKIDFTSTFLDEINVFETTIRYVGGLLAAYDVSGHADKILLEKAVELGDMLYHAFDTPNRMPVTRWDWKNTALGGPQEAALFSLLAEVGSLTLEFTRLSQLTGNPKWYDAIARITNVFEKQQNNTKLPGLFPLLLDTKTGDFTRDTTFSIGGMADSLYEYFPKQHLMLGGRSEQYRNIYMTAMASAKKHIFFRPLNPGNQKLLVAGTLKRLSAARQELIPQGEHLTCFAGGMVALAAKAFQQTNDLEVARQLVNGCLWAYESMPSGIMPEIYYAASCKESEVDKEHDCTWSNEKWYKAIAKHVNRGSNSAKLVPDQTRTVIKESKLAPGFVEIKDPRYMLRPEAIESLFVLYRTTGDKSLQDKAWNMFEAISNMTKTSIAYAGLEDVTQMEPKLLDSMESFWTAETLKYFYLIFSEPDVISLDHYVLNTEAHPLLRPKQ